MAPRIPPTTGRRPALGYLAVGTTSVLLGILGTIPFVMLGYAILQWILAPLGLATPDSSNDDGVAVLLVAGVVLPLAVVAVWVATTRWLARRFALLRAAGWLIALVALVGPVVVFVVVRSA